MQPFDALTIRAVLQEAKPILLNRKVDKVLQLGRDEVLLTLRSKAGMINLLLSAQTAYGRLCLVKMTSQPNERGSGRPGSGGSQSNFSMLLRKHLTGATLVGVEQPLGERMVDFIFSCVDEVGTTSHKILTAEIMGRHSNLIFWDKTTSKVVCASHIVTKDMSRQREVAPGLSFARPPGQDKPSIFNTSKDVLAEKIELLKSGLEAGEPIAPPAAPTLEQWLINSFTGLGRHLAAEIVVGSGVQSSAADSLQDAELLDKLWSRIEQLQSIALYKPAMKIDLSGYTVLSWWTEMENPSVWKNFPAVNDLIEEYYRLVEAREHFNQLKERLRAELRSESEKLELRIASASSQLGNGNTAEELKRNGDLVLANIGTINP
ncbi:MAG: NFACT family protein [Terriglobales bacterium]